MANLFSLLFMATFLIVPTTLSDEEESKNEAEILKKCQILFKTRHAIFLRSLKKILKKAVEKLPQHEISTTEDYFQIFNSPDKPQSRDANANSNVSHSNVGFSLPAAAAGSLQVGIFAYKNC
jgi:hypothetical protein